MKVTHGQWLPALIFNQLISTFWLSAARGPATKVLTAGQTPWFHWSQLSSQSPLKPSWLNKIRNHVAWAVAAIRNLINVKLTSGTAAKRQACKGNTVPSWVFLRYRNSSLDPSWPSFHSRFLGVCQLGELLSMEPPWPPVKILHSLLIVQVVKLEGGSAWLQASMKVNMHEPGEAIKRSFYLMVVSWH